MSKPTQAIWSCARGKHKPPYHVKLTSVSKIWQTQYLCDMKTLCLAAQKGVLLSSKHHPLWVSITGEGVRQLGT